MEREITQLPDRHTGDINNIRDRKIAKATEAASSSDITSQCKLLLENGQTGEFMKVLKGYIDESVRAALGALVSNLDKGSSISKVLATDANNDLGSITPANLASVLSALAIKGGAPEGQIRFLNPGIYRARYSNGNIDLPNDTDLFLLLVIDFGKTNGEDNKMLFAFSFNSTDRTRGFYQIISGDYKDNWYQINGTRL